jgi:hypothetical protein
MKIKHILASLVLMTGAAFGQAGGQFSGGGGISVSGAVTPGDCVQFVTATKITDAGGPCTTGGSGINIQVNAGSNLVSPANFQNGSANDGLTINASNPSGSNVQFNLSGTYAGAVAATTLSASGAVSGTGFSTYLASPPAIGGTTAAAGAFTTLSASSTVSGTGFSTYLASPPAIGGTAPAAGAFTTLSASSTVSGTGFSTYLASPPTIGGTAPAAGFFTTGSFTGNLTTNMTGGPFCVQETSGVLSSTGATCGGSGTLSGQVKGQPTIGLTSSTATTSAGALATSTFCGATLTCPSVTDASFAIQAAVNQVINGGSTPVSAHILYDMCGVQTWSEQPFTHFSGLFESAANCSFTNSNVILLDGLSTITTPSVFQWRGAGINGSPIIPSGTFVRACNPVINNCPNGGFVVQNSSATTITTSVTGAVMTITLAAGAPFDVTATDVNAVQQGRLLCIAGSGTTNNNGCWTWNATTSGTAPQVFKVNVVSGTTTTCASSCGTLYLDTPILAIGNGGGGGVFGTRVDNVTFDCNFVIGCAGPVNAQGEELTGFGEIQVYNTYAFGWRLDQSGAYGGTATTGATNSGPYGPLSNNFSTETCSKTGGCACIANTGSGTNPLTSVSNVCTAGTVAVGALVTVGAGQNTGTVGAVISPDASDNPNYVCSLLTGVNGNQGFGPISHLTCSLSDKSVSGGSPIPGFRGGTTGADPGSSAATTGVAFGIFGVHAGPIGDTHPEYFNLGAQACGNSAFNATWQEAYGAVLTSGVIFDGGFWAFNSGGEGFDIGQSGAASTCQEVQFRGMNIGAGGTSFADNINGNTCTDVVVSYHLGNPTNPVLENSCSTGKGPQLAKLQVGVLNAITGIQINSAAPALQVLSSNGTNFVGALPGVPVDATNPATLLSTDRANFLNWTSGTTLALPAVSGLFASNLPFSIKNTSTTLTITPNAGASDLIDGASSGTLIPNFAAFVYQDATTAPGHWFTIKYPTFAAFGSTCANPLAWSTTTGFSCLSGTSGGVPYFSAANTWGTSGALTSNVLTKGGGAGNPPTNSSVTDNGTTVASTDTGGYVAPVFVANGSTAGFFDFPQGPTSAAVAPCNTANSICYQAPTSVTAQLRVFASAPATGFELFTNSSGTMTETISATSGTLNSGFGLLGTLAINTVLASTVANVAGHFTNIQVVTALGGTCTTLPQFNVFDGASNTGSAVTANAATQTKGTGNSTAQTLTFAAGDVIGIFISTAGGTCVANDFIVSAQYSVP